MAQSKIKWRKSDYLQLGKAVKEFNRKIDKLQALEEKSYLPSKIEYADAKENIVTRAELNRVLKSLRRFKMEGAEDLYVTKAGEEITKWERNELAIQSRITSTRLRNELKALNRPLDNGFSRVEMGSQRPREIEAKLNKIKKLEDLKGYEFNRLREQLKNWGVSDYTMKKAIIYQQNYMRELQKYSHLDNYDALMKQLKNISNPLRFYEFMSRNELTQDLTYQSDQFYTQEAFNSFVEELGINLEFDSIIEENL